MGVATSHLIRRRSMRLVRNLLRIEVIVEAADVIENEDVVAVMVEEALEVEAFMMQKIAIVARK